MIGLSEAYEQCRVITKRASSTFYIGSLFFPTHLQKHTWAIYAFCRYADDVVDESHDAVFAHSQLTLLRHVALAAERRQSLTLPEDSSVEMCAIYLALTDTFVKFPTLQAHAFLELIEGVERDLTHQPFRTYDELLDYCEHVAGGVGEMICQLCGIVDPKTIDAARRMGNAMQLTNIVRDVGEDLKRGRRYLPDSLLITYAVNDTDLQSEAFVPLLRNLITDIRTMYRESRSALTVFPKRVRFALLAASFLYEEILKDVETHHYDVFSRRAYVGTSAKVGCLLRAGALLL